MATLLFSFNTISPLLILLVVGFGLRRASIISDRTVSEINRMIVMLFLPMNIFYNIYRSDFHTDFNPKLILFIYALLFLAFLAIFVGAVYTIKDTSKRSAFIQAAFRGNLALFALPLAISLYGDKVAGLASIILSFSVPLTNAFAVISLEAFNEKKINYPSLIINVLKNPLIIAAIIAILCVILEIKLPAFATTVISQISSLTSPLALIMLGTSFHFHQKADDRLLIGTGCFIKLVLQPILALFIGYLCGFRQAELVVILVIFSAPCAVSCYAMASRSKADMNLTGGIVVYSYLFCAITIPALISILSVLQLI